MKVGGRCPHFDARPPVMPDWMSERRAAHLEKQKRRDAVAEVRATYFSTPIGPKPRLEFRLPCPWCDEEHNIEGPWCTASCEAIGARTGDTHQHLCAGATVWPEEWRRLRGPDAVRLLRNEQTP